MAIILILIIIILFVYLSYHLKVNQIIETYIQTNETCHLSAIGIDEEAFIGLHKKALKLEDTYMLYARKTTGYKGVILFSPDKKLTYRFYLPLINFLCRQGYIIVAHQNKHTLYSKGIQEFENLYQTIVEDEVLGTYPLSCLGHGTGGFIQLCANTAKVLNKVAFQPTSGELEEMLKGVKKTNDYLIKTIIQTTKKKYDVDLSTQPHISCPTYLIFGDQDPLSTIKIDDASIKVLAGQGHYPFLNMDSEQRIKSVECVLCYPHTPQFEYNKTIETFDTSVLYDLNQEVLEILPYLFEYKATDK